MAKKKPSALDALARHDEERRLMEDRRAELKRAAALELGYAVLEAGGAKLSLAAVRRAISAAAADASHAVTGVPSGGDAVAKRGVEGNARQDAPSEVGHG